MRDGLTELNRAIVIHTSDSQCTDLQQIALHHACVKSLSESIRISGFVFLGNSLGVFLAVVLDNPLLFSFLDVLPMGFEGDTEALARPHWTPTAISYNQGPEHWQRVMMVVT
jgi:hypothetical protein